MRNEFSDLVVDNMCKSRNIEKNKWKVDDAESFMRRNCIVQESEDDPSESEASGDRMSRYSSTSSIDVELPELVVFLQETNYEFVKDICIDKAVTSREECFEDCDTENGYVPCMLKSNVAESDSETTEESEDMESSILSTESAQIVKKNLFNKVNEKQKVCYDAIDEIPSDFSYKKSVPKLYLDRKVTGKRVEASANSIAISLTKILNENKHKGKGVAGSNIEHGSVFSNPGLSPSTVGGGGRTSTAEDYAPENQTGLYRSNYGFVYQREDGSSAVDSAFNTVRRPLSSYLGCDSLGSNSSTNSSHSFAFPIQNGTEAQKEWRTLIQGKREGCNCGGYVFPAVISEHLSAQPVARDLQQLTESSSRQGRVMERKDHHQPPPCANPQLKAHRCSANATINCHLNYEYSILCEAFKKQDGGDNETGPSQVTSHLIKHSNPHYRTIAAKYFGAIQTPSPQALTFCSNS